MKNVFKISVIIFSLLFFTNNSFSQFEKNENLKLVSERISLEKGVPNNLIYSIYQDSKGFLWFGTMFGLVRFDGVNYKTYHYDPSDSNSISNDDIISIFEDSSGNLWIGTYNGGLNKYDRTCGIFTRYLNDPDDPNSISNNTVWEIIQDKDGVLWFGTEGGGLNKFENGKFTAYQNDTTNKKSISGNFIRSVASDKDGNIWAGTIATGLNKFDKAKGVFTNYRNEEGNPKSLGNNFAAAIFEDSDGDLWIGTGGGLNKMDKATGEFIQYKHDPKDSNSISDNVIFKISEDSPGNLLIGTQNGLNKFNKKTGKFERIKIFTDDQNKKETVLRFVKDRSGVLWISSYLDGLFKLYYRPQKFQSILAGKNVLSIYTDVSGTIWAGTKGNGLFSTDGKGKNFKTYLNDKNNSNSISSNLINSITEDNESNIWIGTDSGLNKINKSTGRITKYFKDPESENSLTSNNILKLLHGKDGTLWIGTDNGLDKFDEVTQTFVHYKNIRGDSTSLSDNTILSIYQDKFGVLWVGTFGGLNRMNKTGKLRNFKQNPNDPTSISNSYVFSFCEDANNNFWIGTGGGLNIFDRNRETFFHFTEKDGLPNGVISGMESGSDGNLWISTYKGVSRFNLKNKEFKNFSADDGLLSNMFNNGSNSKTLTGEILFGSMDGINAINPLELKQSEFKPDVLLTSLTKYADKEKKEIDISDLKEVELSYKDNIVNLGFSSLDFTNPGKNEYSYMLEGFDKHWNSNGNNTNAVYTNLNPGEYTFKVKATNSDGVWSDKEAALKIIITPPFWKTWWFYGIVICSLVLGAFVIQNYRVRQKVKKVLEIEKVRETERELMREQASRDYHDELGHKLTRISLYSRRINKRLRPTANGLTDDLNSIVETTNSLQSGAKDLIWALNPKEDSLYDFSVRLRDFGNELFENTGIQFSAEGIAEDFKRITLSMNSKRHLIYIFKEGMNNILKYSRCSKVNMKFNLYDDDLEIILEDNGVGFDPDNCPKGYGLKNIFSRATQINVNVNISSREKEGTVIKLKTNVKNLIEA